MRFSNGERRKGVVDMEEEADFVVLLAHKKRIKEEIIK